MAIEQLQDEVVAARSEADAAKEALDAAGKHTEEAMRQHEVGLFAEIMHWQLLRGSLSITI